MSIESKLANIDVSLTPEEAQSILARLRSCDHIAHLASERLLEIIQLRRRIVELEQKVSNYEN